MGLVSVQSQRGRQRGLGHFTQKSLNALQQLFIGDTHSNDVPLANLRAAPRTDSTVPHDPADAETERHLNVSILLPLRSRNPQLFLQGAPCCN